MKWPTTSELSALVPLPARYCFAELDRAMIPALIAAMRVWHPAISVGVASCYLRDDFYFNRVVLDGKLDRDVLVVPITFDGELAGVWSFEREIDSLALYGRLIIIAPDHRGARLAAVALKGTENLGRAMGAAFPSPADANADSGSNVTLPSLISGSSRTSCSRTLRSCSAWQHWCHGPGCT